MEVVRAENLSKSFGFTWALKDINLSLGKGVHLLLGPNGSGKTTFLKLAVGMLRVTRGSIRILGLDPWRQWPELASKVSFAMEGAPLPWWMTGRELLRELCSMKGCSEVRLEKLASELGVTGYWGSSILTYSSGMGKRILLLTAFLAEVELYVLDEPFTLIDRITIDHVIKLITELRDTGSTFLLATHYIPEAFQGLADTFIRFEGGRVVSVERMA